MTQGIPRLRMFAGPNGSGKSTFKSLIEPQLLGIYINPDEIEQKITRKGFLDFSEYQITTTKNEVSDFFIHSELLKKADLLEEIRNISFDNEKLSFNNMEVNSYFASVAADFIRNKLIYHTKSFTFETVMSFPDKIELLKKAQAIGYRTYLYYVATDDPQINISRVRCRVKMGGIQFLKKKFKVDIFDNSTHEQIWLAEITDGKILEMKTDKIPVWCKRALGDNLLNS